MFEEEEEEEEGEVKCNDSGASFFAHSEEEMDRATHKDISALMKKHGTEMIYAVEGAPNKVRVGFTEAGNAAVEEDILKVSGESDLCRRRDVEEALRVAKDNNRIRSAQE